MAGHAIKTFVLKPFTKFWEILTAGERSCDSDSEGADSDGKFNEEIRNSNETSRVKGNTVTTPGKFNVKGFLSKFSGKHQADSALDNDKVVVTPTPS